jgi:hypothetical protein
MEEHELVFSYSNKTISKSFKVQVIDPKLTLQECLESSKKMIDAMKASGIDVSIFEEGYADSSAGNLDYMKTRSFCSDILEQYRLFEEISISIAELGGRIESLGSEGYGTEEMEGYLALVQEAYEMSDFRKAKELLSRADMFIESASQLDKPMILKIKEFLSKNLSMILMSGVILLLSSLVSLRLVNYTKKESRIRRMKREKEKLIGLISSVQEDYFKNKIMTKGMYESFIKGYRKRFGEIEVSLSRLETRDAAEKIDSLIREVQEDYFKKRVIDKAGFEQMQDYYTAEKIHIQEQVKKECSRNHAFYLKEGKILSSLHELYLALDDMDIATFSHHVAHGRNDFSDWIRHVFKEDALADKIAGSKTMQEMKDIMGEYCHER